MQNVLIRIQNVVKDFKGVRALSGVSFDVPPTAIYGLIGPNGAGKTTLINVINGVYGADEGDIYFKGRNIINLRSYEIAQMGISRTFQIARVFKRMTVMENMLSPYVVIKKDRSHILDRANELLEFVGLWDKRDQYAIELSGGQQKLLEFARALMPDPELLLMDEPFAGIHPELRRKLMDLIRRLNVEYKKTFLIVSHDMRSISELCQHVVVLNFGTKLAEGNTQEILKDEKVIEAYLGE